MSSRSRLTLAAVTAWLMAATYPAVAEDSTGPKKAHWITPANADPAVVEKNDPDFSIQGEYAGEWLSPGGEGTAIGVQVKALGRGKFQMHVFQGGLPGDGWNPKSKKVGPTSLARKDGKVTGVDPKGNTINIENGKLIGTDKKGKRLAVLARVERESRTLGMKPPEGALVLFDGTDAEGWEPIRDRRLKKTFSALTDKGHLLRGTRSKKKFQSCKLHLEFRVPWEPNSGGQGRGNSGVYVQQRYEVQVLDSFGDPPAQGHCGGIYSIATPPFVMSYPPLRWQTYDIEFTKAEFEPAQKGKGRPKRVKDATISVWHNGVQIHENVKIFRDRTTASPKSEGPGPESIFLQDHGHWVVYRNVWIVEK